MTRVPESELYGYANVRGSYWNWKKNCCKRFVIIEKTGYLSYEPEAPADLKKNLCRLNGVSLKRLRKRDEKPWHKPKKYFKKMREEKFRAKCKHEMRTGRMNFPPNKKTDIWDWL
jgi:hypothetical protein